MTAEDCLRKHAKRQDVARAMLIAGAMGVIQIAEFEAWRPCAMNPEMNERPDDPVKALRRWSVEKKCQAEQEAARGQELDAAKSLAQSVTFWRIADKQEQHLKKGEVD